MKNKNLSQRITENGDLIIGTVVGVFVLAIMGFPLINTQTEISTTISNFFNLKTKK
ncbi:hypothetical protein [Kaistella sp.]|uniref:hypothetical protein n=1 Tax=Kaistella sp. TaxID=2782235 RepID=UPI003C451D7F